MKVRLEDRPRKREKPHYRAAAIVQTPWGESSQLRARKLAPNVGVPPAEVQRIQRERLHGAMVAAVATHGYEGTSVAHLLELSGVSRRTFYQLYRDKQDCFVATVEAIMERTLAVAGAQLSGNAPWQEEGRVVLRTVFEMCAAQPAAARMLSVDAHAVGAEALEPIFRAVEELVPLAEMGSGDRRRRESVVGVIRAVSGGIHRVIYERLMSGRENELPGCAEDVWDWAISYSPLPGPLRVRARRTAKAGASPPFAAHISRERILRGFAAAVAKHGYRSTRIAEIAAAARISRATFYIHFESKADAMNAALDTSGAQMVAATLPGVRRAESWQEGIRVAVDSMAAFMAAEPDFARLRALEAYAAGPAAVAIRDRALTEVLETALALDRAAPALQGLQGEAVVGALNGVFFDAVNRGGGEALLAAAPVGAYMVLAPLVGPERAYEVAVGEWPRPGRSHHSRMPGAMDRDKALEELASFALGLELSDLAVHQAVVGLDERQDGEEVTRVILLLDDPEGDRWELGSRTKMRQALGMKATDLDLPAVSVTLVPESDRDSIEAFVGESSRWRSIRSTQ